MLADIACITLLGQNKGLDIKKWMRGECRIVSLVAYDFVKLGTICRGMGAGRRLYQPQRHEAAVQHVHVLQAGGGGASWALALSSLDFLPVQTSGFIY